MERGLERVTCQIVHFNRPDETEVTTAVALARRLSGQMPLTTPFLAAFDVTGESILAI